MPATGQVTATAYSVEDAGGHVAYGETVNADLDTPGERGVWTFTGAVNDRVSVAINSSTVTACNSGSLTLLRPDGTTLATTTKICGGTVLTATLPTSGTYTFMVDPNGAITATVAVQLERGSKIYDHTLVKGLAVFGFGQQTVIRWEPWD